MKRNVAASLLLHLTPQSSAYLENVWVWTTDHDMDIPAQTRINVYSGRRLLIESQGPTWMYGTASEHNVMYQYQVSEAKDLYMAMIQTESPYYQPSPEAPSPFTAGLFPNDPTFTDCIKQVLKAVQYLGRYRSLIPRQYTQWEQMQFMHSST